ncbi:hypothetical protein ARMGADRAFT_560367 [Armillaria gallica]|uniref:Uncharacterized protein n=1 Tax=Armillaria gallica TaxID=47427 RepID=A0A2H3CRC4_ARMGA|nr:hypothetical protein ARMGADRAFT_560367 [Armillaria gallica]
MRNLTQLHRQLRFQKKLAITCSSNYRSIGRPPGVELTTWLSNVTLQSHVLCTCPPLPPFHHRHLCLICAHYAGRL